MAIAGTAQACDRGDPGATGAPPNSDLRPATIVLAVANPTVEPLDSVFVSARVLDQRGEPLAVEHLVVWATSDTLIAVVNAGRVNGRSPGPVDITAALGGVSARARMFVAWRDDARLVVFPNVDAIDAGVLVPLSAFIRNRPVAAASIVWTTSDPSVALVNAGGTLAPIRDGTATITGRYAGLATSFVVRVGGDGSTTGFGYAYSGQAPVLEDYDAETVWSPPAAYAYSTSGSAVELIMMPPYPARPEFGWLGPGDVRRSLVLHAVSLEGTRCIAMVYVGFIAGAMASCWDIRSSNRFEMIAATPDAFSGTLAFIRPGVTSVTSTGAAVTERVTSPGVREYSVPALGRSESYWFVSAASWEPGGCVVAPAADTPASTSAVVLCANRGGALASIPHNAIAFGQDARRGDESRVFVELDSAGRVMRRSEAGITLTSALAGRGITTISLSGPRVAEKSRAPAVFLTPVATSPNARCWMSEPTGVGAPTVTFDVQCDVAAQGVLVGATY